MILRDETDIFDTIIKKRGCELLDYSREKHHVMQRHISGKGLKKWKDQHTKIFSPEDRELIDQFMHPFSRPILKSAIDLIDKIFTAEGKHVEYAYNSQSSETEPEDVVLGDLNVTRFLSERFKTVVNLDPMSLFLIERDESDDVDQYKIRTLYTTQIYDYWFDEHGKVEYVVLEIPELETDTHVYYRVIDDMTSWIVQKSKQSNPLNPYPSFKLITSLDAIQYNGEEIFSFDHGFQTCPAVIVSNNVAAEYHKDHRDVYTTYVDGSESLLDQYNIFSLLFVIYTARVSLPRKWELTSEDYSNSDYEPVDDDIRPAYVSSDGRLMEQLPESPNQFSKKTIDVALTQIGAKPPFEGFTQPDVSHTKQLIDNIEYTERLISDAIWGQGVSVDKERSNTTAFEISTRRDPQVSKLQRIANNIEHVHKQIVDIVGQARLGNTYQGVSVNYGRDYVLETNDNALEKYAIAKREGATDATLDFLYDQYLKTQYQGNDDGYTIAYNVFFAQPAPHLTTLEASKAQVLSVSEIKIKANYQYLVSLLTQSELLSDIDTVKMRIIELHQQKLQDNESESSIPERGTESNLGENIQANDGQGGEIESDQTG